VPRVAVVTRRLGLVGTGSAATDFGDAVGLSVAGQLWQAPQPRSEFNALRAEQINLPSRNQASQLYRLLASPA
jgi:hypothetical protein